MATNRPGETLGSDQAVIPFFVGSGRSGTTLVQAIFSAHPELAIAHESQFIPKLAHRKYSVRGRFDSERFLRDLERHPDFARLAIDVDALRTDLVSSPPASYVDAVRGVFRAYATGRGKTMYGDKTPGYVLHMELLAGLLPEARFVHVVRDGRDVTLSYLQSGFGPGTIAEGALFWRRRVTVGRRSGNRLGPGRYLELRYEDLVADPEPVVGEVCRFLDLTYVPDMLHYYEDAQRIRSDTAVPAAHRHLDRPPTAGLRDWRVEMSTEDALVFEALAGHALEAFSYERSSPRSTPTSVLRAGRGWVAWQAKRLAVQRRGLTRRGRRALGTLH